MYKLLFLIPIWLVLIGSPAFALDKFMNYRNISPAQSTDEDMPVVPDVNYAIKQGYVNTYELTASTNKEITVPTGSKFAVFAADANIWVVVGTTTAAIPSGDTTDGTGAELNPSIRYLGSETKINVISASAALISIMFYK